MRGEQTYGNLISDKIKQKFFRVVAVSVLLYERTTSTWKKKRPEKKLDENYRRVLRAVLNKSWNHHLWGTRRFVAKRTSYFCLVRNLIWPLGSRNIFTQSGWLILFSLDHLSEQHQRLGKAAKIFFLPQNASIRTDVSLSALQ